MPTTRRCLSPARFDLAYNAAHAPALTALRLQGYRSDKRYLVFQCLAHTFDVGKAQVRLFALCHERRNMAEYEGYMDVDEALLADLIAATDALLPRVRQAMSNADRRGNSTAGQESALVVRRRSCSEIINVHVS